MELPFWQVCFDLPLLASWRQRRTVEALFHVPQCALATKNSAESRFAEGVSALLIVVERGAVLEDPRIAAATLTGRRLVRVCTEAARRSEVVPGWEAAIPSS